MSIVTLFKKERHCWMALHKPIQHNKQFMPTVQQAKSAQCRWGDQPVMPPDLNLMV